MSIYTKTGDKGETSLFGGKRVLKCEELVDAYGSIDELNSWIGLVISSIDHAEKKEFLQKIQADLFTIGGSLAGWETDLSHLPTRVTEMEVEIDAMETILPELKNFILPGGTKEASQVHLARSICRRVERQVVGLGQIQVVDERVVAYLNRLSDLFFVLGRFINKSAGIHDVVWQGIERT